MLRSFMGYTRRFCSLSVPVRTIAIILVFSIMTGIFLIAQGTAIKAKAVLAQILLEDAWQESLESGDIKKPWPWADTWPVAKIEFPRLGESEIILSSASGQSMAFGPGHVQSTPLPGKDGTSVIAAHRDTHFKMLKDIKIGDVVKVALLDGTTKQFRITQTWVANWDKSGVFADSFGKKIALVTCWPFDAIEPGPERFIAQGELVE